MIKITASFPDSKLLPNRMKGRHWSVTSSLKKKAYEEGYYLAKQTGETLKSQNTAISLKFTCRDKRRRDLDNLLSACKSLLDGLSEGFGIDDKYFRPITIDFGEPDKNNPKVDLTIHNDSDTI